MIGFTKRAGSAKSVDRRPMRTLILSGVCLTIVAVCLAHEGHQPLPTRGVQVDVAKGTITLSDSSRRLMDVQTVTVDQGQLVQKLPAFASVVVPWDRRAVVTTRVAGRVVQLLARPGDRVLKGQAIAEIRSPELDQLRESIDTARNTARSAREIIEGLKSASTAGAVPGQRMIEAELDLRQAENEARMLLERARMLDVLPTRGPEDPATEGPEPELMTSVVSIRSPLTGTVMHSDLALDKYVDPADHVMEIVDSSYVDVRFVIPERDWSNVHVGQAVSLFVNGLDSDGRTARIESLGGMPDRETRQTLAWATLENTAGSPQLVPGMNGYAELSTDAPESALLVPTKSILSDGAERYVLVEHARTKKGSEYQKTAVVTGRESLGQTEILVGKLTPGDQIVTDGGHELSSVFVRGVLRLSPESERSIGLQLASAESAEIETVLTLDGRVDLPPDQRAQVSAAVAGTLTAVHVRRGQRVAAGDVLGDISSVPAQELQLHLLRTHLDWVAWDETLQRRRAADDALSRRTLIETESRVRALRIQWDSLAGQLRAAGLTQEQIQTLVDDGVVVESIPLKASISGVVAEFNGLLGQLVAVGDPVFEVHDTTQFQVQAFVRAQDAVRVQKDQAVRVRLDAFPEQIVAGTVRLKAPMLQSTARAQSVWVITTEGLPPGVQHAMTARVTVTVGSSPAAVTVPVTAVIRDGLQAFIFVRLPDGAFERRRVETGRFDDRRVEITAGLTAGEPVAVEGVQQLQTAYATVR